MARRRQADRVPALRPGADPERRIRRQAEGVLQPGADHLFDHGRRGRRGGVEGHLVPAGREDVGAGRGVECPADDEPEVPRSDVRRDRRLDRRGQLIDDGIGVGARLRQALTERVAQPIGVELRGHRALAHARPIVGDALGRPPQVVPQVSPPGHRRERPQLSLGSASRRIAHGSQHRLGGGPGAVGRPRGGEDGAAHVCVGDVALLDAGQPIRQRQVGEHRDRESAGHDREADLRVVGPVAHVGLEAAQRQTGAAGHLVPAEVGVPGGPGLAGQVRERHGLRMETSRRVPGGEEDSHAVAHQLVSLDAGGHAARLVLPLVAEDEIDVAESKRGQGLLGLDLDELQAQARRQPPQRLNRGQRQPEQAPTRTRRCGRGRRWCPPLPQGRPPRSPRARAAPRRGAPGPGRRR